MNVVIKIDGRDAIPVRALPYVARWKFEASSDAIAAALAARRFVWFYSEIDGKVVEQETEIPHRRALTAFRVVDESGVVQTIDHTDWRVIVKRIKLDTLTIQECESKGDSVEYSGPDGYYVGWRIRSLVQLPINAFVWLDDFQTWFTYTRPLGAYDPEKDYSDDYEPKRESDELITDPDIHHGLIPALGSELTPSGIALLANFPWPSGMTENELDRTIASITKEDVRRINQENASRPRIGARTKIGALFSRAVHALIARGLEATSEMVRAELGLHDVENVLCFRPGIDHEKAISIKLNPKLNFYDEASKAIYYKDENGERAALASPKISQMIHYYKTQVQNVSYTHSLEQPKESASPSSVATPAVTQQLPK